MRDDEDDESERVFEQGRRRAAASARPATRKTTRAAAKPSSKVRRRQRDQFVQVPLWWAEAVAKATRNPRLLVCIELLHRSWKARSLTFPLPNGELQRGGATREAKRRVLRDLETAGLLTVERRHGKTPIVSLTLI